MSLRASHRTTILFGRYLSALAAHLFDASADYRKIISNAGSGHVSSCPLYARPLSNPGSGHVLPAFL
jgi:hypothetical protein